MKRLALILFEDGEPLNPPPGSITTQIVVTDQLLRSDSTERALEYGARQLAYALSRLVTRPRVV